MQVDSRALVAIPAVEGAASIEIRHQNIRIIPKQPQRAPWLFALKEMISGMVDRACECTPERVESGVTVQQGEVVYQRFPHQILAEGEGCGVVIDVPVVQPTEYSHAQIHQARTAFRRVWFESLLLNLDRRPVSPLYPKT
jgi:hypothetical protein